MATLLPKIFASFLPPVVQTAKRTVLNYVITISNTSHSTRYFSTSSAVRLKEILVETEGDKIMVSGKYVKSNREDSVVRKSDPHHSCPICRLGDIRIKYTDVLILAQFVRSDGEMLPQSVTGLCNKQHRILRQRIQQAKSAGLMPNRRPDNTHPDDITPIQDRQINEGNFNIYHKTWERKKIPHFEGHEVKHWVGPKV